MWSSGPYERRGKSRFSSEFDPRTVQQLVVYEYVITDTRLLSTNKNTDIYKTTVLDFIVYGCGTWSVILVERHRWMVFENMTFRGTSGEYLCVDKAQLTQEFVHKK